MTNISRENEVSFG